MRNEAIWAIRDAVGLNQNEKALLWAIESCGTAKRTWEGMAALAGMKKSAFYEARKSLIEKGLILVCRKHNAVSWYTVELEAVSQLSGMRNEEDEDSVSRNELSGMRNELSGMPETKKNTKKNKKKNMKDKEEQETVASAPVVPLDETKEGSPNSPLEEPALLPLEVEHDADSVIQNEWAKRSPKDWLEIMRQRPLTKDEKDFRATRAWEFNQKQREAAVEEKVAAW